TGVDFEGRLILSGGSCRHKYNIDTLSIFCQGKNALGMRFFCYFAKLRADQGPRRGLDSRKLAGVLFGSPCDRWHVPEWVGMVSVRSPRILFSSVVASVAKVED